jgi:hypothetical protein
MEREFDSLPRRGNRAFAPLELGEDRACNRAATEGMVAPTPGDAGYLSRTTFRLSVRPPDMSR